MNFDELRQQLFELLMSNQIDDATYDRRLNLLEQQAVRKQAEDERLKNQSLYRASLSDDLDDVETTPFVILPGHRVGKYALLETRGEGGMGIVWKARDTELDLDVAIKILPPALQRQSGDLERFKKTFQMVKRLHHDHICPLYDMGYQNHPDIGWYQVMRLIDGRTLADYRDAHVEEHGDFPLSEVVRLLDPVARALDYANGLKIAHRDIKPENIFLEGAGLEVVHVWLIDFGIAAVIRGTLTQAASVESDAVDTAGSRPYMAPELFQAGQPGSASDQYALVVVAYELLAGYPPFSSDDFSVLRHAVIHDAVPEIDDQTDAVNTVLARALAKDRKQRFESSAGFLAALAKCLTPTPTAEFLRRMGTPARPADAAIPAAVKSARPTSPPPLLSAPFSEAHILAARRQWAEFLGQPETVPLPGGSRCLLIPPGEFTMGSQMPPEELVKQFETKGYGKSDASYFKRELPAHRVKLTKAFRMAEHPVTVGEFKSFVVATGHKTDAEKDGGGWAYDVAAKKWQKKADCLWWSPGFSQTEQHPVVVVSHNDAVAYCTWLSQQSGHQCRLAWEAEWEYAARAGTTGFYFHGDDPEGLSRYANVADAALKQQIADWPWATIRANDGHAFTSPVGRFEPNPFGLRDVLGNCWEWCGDWFAEDYYAKCPEDDPRGPSSGSSRVLRGGSWHDEPQHCRCSYRDLYDPTNRNDNIGFRVIMEL